MTLTIELEARAAVIAPNIGKARDIIREAEAGSKLGKTQTTY